MRLLTPAVVFVVAVALAGAATRARADSDDGSYQLPLVGRYAIFRPTTSLTPSAATRSSDLVRSFRAGGSGGMTLLDNVEQVAVERNLIFGKAKAAYFILDGTVTEAVPRTFDAPEAWQEALAGAGISNPGSLLKTPDALAPKVPAQMLRPWNYRMMHNRLGFSDNEWSAIVQGLGALLAFLIGLLWTGRRRAIPEAVVLGLVVNVVAQVVIAGGGPGAFVGFVGLPLVYLLAVALGAGVRGLGKLVFT
jgi:hypothetical protein